MNLLICVTTLAIIFSLKAENAAGAINKSKLLRLVKKLETAIKLADFEERDTKKTSTSEETTQAPTSTSAAATTEATTVSSFVKDPNKKYCDEAVCPELLCTAKDFATYANFRKTGVLPTSHQVCDGRMSFTFFYKSQTEGLNLCCAGKMSLVTVNSETKLSCIKTAQSKGKTGSVKYWTSGRFAKSCNSYVWCPDKEIIGPDVKWKKGYPKDYAGDCVAISMGNADPNNNGIFNTRCSDALSSCCFGSDYSTA